jgi:hypothetical protein
VSTSAAVAQQPGQGMGPGPGARSALLRGRIEEQFVRRIQADMGLSDEATGRMQRVVTTWATRRRALEREEMRLRQALNGQLRPGVAANGDSVGSYVDALNENRVAYAQSFRDEMKELAPVLTPVQRGQFQQMRDRLMLRMEEVQKQGKAPPP